MAMRTITIAAPVFNEDTVIGDFLEELSTLVAPLVQQYAFRFLVVNDGSRDQTLSKLEAYDGPFPLKVIDLGRNFGHPVACAACLAFAEGDAVILMDADLQDDPAAIPRFLELWQQGHEVVYAVRESRPEGLCQRFLFGAFYRCLAWISRVDLPLDSGNFSLMDRKVVDAINQVTPHNRYLPGLRSYMGFSQVGIPVPRRARPNGASHVGLGGMFRLAFNGIFAFSYMPIRLFDVLGAIALLVALVLSVYVLSAKLFFGTAIQAWSSQMITIIFFGGINLLGIGIVGEYMARIYDEIRKYPSYTVRGIFERGGRSDRST